MNGIFLIMMIYIKSIKKIEIKITYLYNDTNITNWRTLKGKFTMKKTLTYNLL